MKKTITTILFLALIFPISCIGQEKTVELSPEIPEIKVWKIPDHMLENLRYMVEEFNRIFKAKIEKYKAELKLRYPEFRDLPDDVIFDPSAGIFVLPDDYRKIIEKKEKKK